MNKGEASTGPSYCTLPIQDQIHGLESAAFRLRFSCLCRNLHTSTAREIKQRRRYRLKPPRRVWYGTVRVRYRVAAELVDALAQEWHNVLCFPLAGRWTEISPWVVRMYCSGLAIYFNGPSCDQPWPAELQGTGPRLLEPRRIQKPRNGLAKLR